MNQEIKKRLEHLTKVDYPDLNMKDLFRIEKDRFSKYHLKNGSILLDYSKNKLNNEIFLCLLRLAKSAKVEKYRDKMFKGDKINVSEERAVLHTVLRDFSDKEVIVDGINIKTEVTEARERMKLFVDEVHNGKRRGYSGKKLTDVVNIGIGGSDLGSKMVVEALKPYHLNKTQVHFISNVDAESILSITSRLNPETTLFIVSSKSFNTQEVLVNLTTARQWIFDFYRQDKLALSKHFLIVSNAIDKVKELGIDIGNNYFYLWDWVGGRYSLWSAIGIPIVFAIGFNNFENLLKGASCMDQHFKSTPLSKNIPVILALISTLYINFHHVQSQAVLAYDDRLCYLIDYLQQVDMESNGKSYKKNGNPIKQTGVVLWGGVGTNGQHAFYQLLHQGTSLTPVDFIVIKNPNHRLRHHHQVLLANCFAQSQALMVGKSLDEAIMNLKPQDLPDNKMRTLALQKVVSGNKPSNTIIIDELTPHALGELIAMYEHKIFTQGILWEINSFDQWGVELGKSLSKPILRNLEQGTPLDNTNYDSSTLGLLNYIR